MQTFTEECSWKYHLLADKENSTGQREKLKCCDTVEEGVSVNPTKSFGPPKLSEVESRERAFELLHRPAIYVR